MKRFFAIFGICFASIIVVVGAVFGIKFLKGDFNPKIINPESIAFEYEEYEVVGDFKIKITTETEDVTATTITLSFEKGTTFNTYGKDYITDGVIIIPKKAQLNVPFDVKLFLTKDQETEGNDWIKGGISNIVATSESLATVYDKATVYVDVPVYKTELVLLNGNTENIGDGKLTFLDSFKSVENSQLAKTTKEDLKLSLGDTFYIGLKYYPARSAYKYSKISSTNLFVEYYNQIIAKMSELNLDYSSQINLLNNLFEKNNLNFQEIINAYLQIINLSSTNADLTQFTSFLNTLNTEFTNNLKYYTFEEETSYLNKLDRVPGTNIYKLQVKTDDNWVSGKVDASLYSYTFFNSQIENETKQASTSTDLLVVLENLHNQQGNLLADKKVDKGNLTFSVENVDVNQIDAKGTINSFYTNSVHTIYALKDGTNSDTTSYLKIDLKNNASSVNLQNRIFKLGLRFEKNTNVNNWEDATEIEFVDKDNYKTVEYAGKTYYFPVGSSDNYNNAYWQIYSNSFVTNNLRAVLVYFKTTSGKITDENIVQTDISLTFTLKDATANEEVVSWNNLNALQLGIVNLKGIIDMNGTIKEDESESLKNYTYNKEIDLTKLINIPTDNKFQTYKFFLYTDDTKNSSISTYFYTNDEGNNYSLNGITKKLYELDGNILKLKGENIPDFAVKVMFATLKTDALGKVEKENGLYTFIKYSASKNGAIENLSSLLIGFTSSFSKVTGELQIKDTTKAGVVDEQLKLAQNAENVLSLQINSSDVTDYDKIKTATINGSLKISARTDKNNVTSYVTFTYTESTDGLLFNISTTNVTTDTNVRFYFVYTIDGNDYLFPITIKNDNESYYVATILKNTASTATFAFTDSNGNVEVLQDADYITVKTTEIKSSNIVTGYKKAYYLNNTKIELTISDANGCLLVSIKNFLGNEDATAQWFLKSNNLSVATIQGDKFVNFIGAGNVTIDLCLGTSDQYEVKDSISFAVEDSGYVTKVIVNEKNVFEYNNSGSKWTFTKQIISLTKTKNDADTIKFDELLKMDYTLTAPNSDASISLTIKPANEDTVTKINAIFTKGNTIDINSGLTFLTLNKNLAESVSLDLLYVNYDLGITQPVTLILNPVVSVDDLTVTRSDSSITEPLTMSNGKYNIYAGLTYTVSFKIIKPTSDNGDIYYRKDKNGTCSVGTAKTNDEYSFTFSFDDWTADTSHSITLTNVALEKDANPGIGDLNNILQFKVLNNITVKSETITKNLEGNTLNVSLGDILTRNEGKLESYPILGDLSIDLGSPTVYAADNGTIATNEISHDNTNTTIKFTFNSFTNELTIKFKILIGEKDSQTKVILGGTNAYITIKVLPQDLANSDNRFTIYNGEKAIVVTNGEELKDSNNNGISIEDFFKALFTDSSSGAGTGSGTSTATANEITVKITNKKGEDTSLFKSTYTNTVENITKIIQTTNDLFTNTNCYVSVTQTVNEKHITNQYLIVISKLKFPFVNFIDKSSQNADPNAQTTLSYKNLDIYKLFVNTSNLVEYYKEAGIAYFTPTINEETQNSTLTLVDYNATTNTTMPYVATTSSEDSITNQANFADGYTVTLKDGSSAKGYATIEAGKKDTSATENSNLTLTTYPVGAETYLIVYVQLTSSAKNSYSSIPIVVKLEATQTVKVAYPNSNNGELPKSDIDNYGSDAYDQNWLNRSYTPFENPNMEYLAFDSLSGTATLNLLGTKLQRLFVYNGANLNADFETKNYTIEPIKVVVNISGTWAEIDKNNFSNYVTISSKSSATTNDKITDIYVKINKNVADIVRVKLKVLTNTGATNYYYISAGEIENLTLMKQSNSIVSSVGTVDSCTVKSNDVIIIGGDNTNNDSFKYFYYLSNTLYNNKLYFRVLDTNGNVAKATTTNNNVQTIDIYDSTEIKKGTIEVDSKKITLGVFPTGATFTIEIYTQYGICATVTVTVEPAYTFEVNDSITNFYSGTTYGVGESSNSDNAIVYSYDTSLIDTLKGYKVSVSKPEDFAVDNYTVNDESNQIIFSHLTQGQNNAIFDLKLTITLTKGEDENLSFTITFKNFEIKQRIVALTEDVIGLNVTESGGEINLANVKDSNGQDYSDFFKNLFIDKKDADLTTTGNFDTTKFTDLLYYVKLGTNEWQQWKEENNKLSIGTITSTSSYQITFAIAKNDQNTSTQSSVTTLDETNIIASKSINISVSPEYTVTLNYPTVNGEFTSKEFVQVGGSINFDSTTFENKKRIVVEKTADSQTTNINYDIYCYKEKINNPYTFQNTGTYSFDIRVNDVTYATYVVEVTTNSPIAFIQNTTTIYAGVGDNDVFGVFDIVVTLPTIENAPDQVTLMYGKESDAYKTKLVENVYYRTGEKIRTTLGLDEYANFKNGIYEVYVQTGTSNSPIYTKCDFTVSTRCTLTYNGAEIAEEYYENILSNVDLSKKEITTLKGTIIEQEISSNSSNIASSTKWTANLTYKYDLNFGEFVDQNGEFVESKMPTLNANEKESGRSFVELFNVSDNLGNKFWLNNVGDKTFSLTLGSYTSNLPPMRIDPVKKDDIIYDYMLKPLGGAYNETNVGNNKHTEVTITVMYDKLKVELKVKIVSDIIYELYNNDGTSTPNSETNPLKLTYSGEDTSFTLTSLNQTKYIYAYGKYSSQPTNQVQNWNAPAVNGDSSFIVVSKDTNTNAIIIKLNKASFGNKNLTLTFTDPYGLSFNYYIELIAEVDIVSIVVDNKQIYEDESIDIYNKNIPNNSSEGIAISLTNSNGAIDTTTGFAITSLEFKIDGTYYAYNNSTITDKVTVSYSDATIILGFLNETEWSGANNKTYRLRIKIKAKVDDATEEYAFEVDLTIYKRYSLEMQPQNVFVRDNTSIDLAHFVDVYDYKQQAYLGRPTLTQYEKVSAVVDLNKIAVNENYDSLQAFAEAQLEIINNTSKTDDEKNAAWEALSEYGLFMSKPLGEDEKDYTLTHLGIALQINAVKKSDGITQSQIAQYEVVKTTSNSTTISYTIKPLVTLGANDSLFGAGVTNQDYYFEFQMYNLNSSSAFSAGKIATTKASDVSKDTTKCPIEAKTGNIYRLQITNSKNVNEIHVALNVSGESSPVLFEISDKKYDDYLDKYSYKDGGESQEIDFINKTIELFTGEINGTTYVNGLSGDDVKKSKNIKLLAYENNDSYAQSTDFKPLLDAEGAFGSDDKYNIMYQEITKNLKVWYAEYGEVSTDDSTGKVTEDSIKNYAFETANNQKLNVTTKFTGVDTSDAYTGTMHYCYVTDLVGTDGKIDNAGKIIELGEWSQGFKLVAGVGISSILASAEDKTFAENIISELDSATLDANNVSEYYSGKITFEKGNVYSSSGSNPDSNAMVTIEEETGAITLTSAFIPDQYYISIKVNCTYGASYDSTTKKATYKKITIGTIYVSFVNVTGVSGKNLTVSSDKNTYTMDITNFVPTETSPQTASNSLAKTDKKLALFDLNSSNKATLLAESKSVLSNLLTSEQKNETSNDSIALTADETSSTSNITLSDISLGSAKITNYNYENGKHTITIDNTNNELIIGEMYLLKVKNKSAYITFGKVETLNAVAVSETGESSGTTKKLYTIDIKDYVPLVPTSEGSETLTFENLSKTDITLGSKEATNYKVVDTTINETTTKTPTITIDNSDNALISGEKYLLKIKGKSYYVIIEFQSGSSAVEEA